MRNITGFGYVISIVASNTFPAGIVITQAPDDTDPIDAPSIRIGEAAMGVNGDLLTWARAVANPVVLNVVPGSLADVNLNILAQANRAVQGKQSAADVITMTITYPDGTIVNYANGIITDAPFGKSISSQGRLKTKSYAFTFESSTGN